MKSASAWDVLGGVDFNYAAEAVHAADGEHGPAAIMLPSRFREPCEEQVLDEVELNGTTNGALYAVVPAVASR